MKMNSSTLTYNLDFIGRQRSCWALGTRQRLICGHSVAFYMSCSLVSLSSRVKTKKNRCSASWRSRESRPGAWSSWLQEGKYSSMMIIDSYKPLIPKGNLDMSIPKTLRTWCKQSQINQTLLTLSISVSNGNQIKEWHHWKRLSIHGYKPVC